MGRPKKIVSNDNNLKLTNKKYFELIDTNIIDKGKLYEVGKKYEITNDILQKLKNMKLQYKEL